MASVNFSLFAKEKVTFAEDASLSTDGPITLNYFTRPTHNKLNQLSIFSRAIRNGKFFQMGCSSLGLLNVERAVNRIVCYRASPTQGGEDAELLTSDLIVTRQSSSSGYSEENLAAEFSYEGDYTFLERQALILMAKSQDAPFYNREYANGNMARDHEADLANNPVALASWISQTLKALLGLSATGIKDGVELTGDISKVEWSLDDTQEIRVWVYLGTYPFNYLEAGVVSLLEIPGDLTSNYSSDETLARVRAGLRKSNNLSLVLRRRNDQTDGEWPLK